VPGGMSNPKGKYAQGDNAHTPMTLAIGRGDLRPDDV
jgi:hypothetical protein